MFSTIHTNCMGISNNGKTYDCSEQWTTCVCTQSATISLLRGRLQLCKGHGYSIWGQLMCLYDARFRVRTMADLNKSLILAIYEVMAGTEECLLASPPFCSPATQVRNWPS